MTRPPLTRAERFLYHQVHPLKLLTDFTTSFASTWLIWQSSFIPAALVAFVPSIAVTWVLLWRADLERYAELPIGRYIARFMTHRIEALRFSGQLLMWAGAAAHVPWLIPLGLAVVVYGWLSGFWTPPNAVTGTSSPPR